MLFGSFAEKILCSKKKKKVIVHTIKAIAIVLYWFSMYWHKTSFCLPFGSTLHLTTLLYLLSHKTEMCTLHGVDIAVKIAWPGICSQFCLIRCGSLLLQPLQAVRIMYLQNPNSGHLFKTRDNGRQKKIAKKGLVKLPEQLTFAQIMASVAAGLFSWLL